MRYLAITGPTGSGKSHLAKILATGLNGEIVGCDSVQIYRNFDIGSAKESQAIRMQIPHHMIDIIDWQQSYDAAQYARDARKVIADINRRGKIAIVAGGTGLYLRALIGNKFHDLPTDPELRAELAKLSTETLYRELVDLDPERAKILHQNDRVRLLRAVELVKLLGKSMGEIVTIDAPQFLPEISIYVNPARPILHKKIEERSHRMLDDGLIDEVQSLLKSGCPTSIKPMQSIGYAQVVKFLGGSIEKADLTDKIIFATRQYAKRQCTWFGKLSHEIRLESLEGAESLVKAVRERMAL
jgi:tRNA dimethylallyltransferase